MSSLKRSWGTKLLGAGGYERLRTAWYGSMQMRANRRAVPARLAGGDPYLAHEIAWLTGRDSDWVLETASEYAATPAAWERLAGLRSPARRTDGISMSMDVAEGFAAWALIKHLRPNVVVELGSLYGVSARLWKEALKCYVPDHRLFLCDLVDSLRYVGKDEATLLLGDGVAMLEKMLAQGAVDLLFNDAHPYTLIRDTIRIGLDGDVACFAFHDVGGRALRNYPYFVESASATPAERIENSTNFARYGHWERHCMAEAWDERILTQDAVAIPGWRLQIFDSLFGFGVALRVSDAPEGGTA